MCPLCSTPLKQHLIQPTLALISCPLESCIYPFNLLVAELHDNQLLIEVDTADIMAKMESKMVKDVGVDEKLAEFIAREDPDVGM
ncbi:uncharacterized protein CANTADRAFT_56469 [Suhomyces tanzawaensis NRRL Y-17324]|uniref:Uncharacterized protein n=1 Tax=Suhomyces tanzawaensis NRRL Y-17324 TaxID=984487 RepID=A0A1E4SDF7_9ASCO|nr:uncharacterized protein CANTADRAFT_56469 [Suhomyces tanzawaensis NRRL Y-17324]ODV77549.1 hypothetical protein CANTADRAFT_56469 [Suhomyces tanzawaensis NRRL Y-17324]